MGRMTQVTSGGLSLYYQSPSPDSEMSGTRAYRALLSHRVTGCTQSTRPVPSHRPQLGAELRAAQRAALTWWPQSWAWGAGAGG